MLDDIFLAHEARRKADMIEGQQTFLWRRFKIKPFESDIWNLSGFDQVLLVNEIRQFSTNGPRRFKGFQTWSRRYACQLLHQQLCLQDHARFPTNTNHSPYTNGVTNKQTKIILFLDKIEKVSKEGDNHY